MGMVDTAFAALKSNLEITTSEQNLAQSRHKLVRDHVRTRWTLTDDFLTGSYDRHTKTKKLKDVDMNRPGFDAAPFLEKDADHAQALPHRAA
ncbi:MAG: hypothetical protein WAX14_00450 [Rhodococcus sp. (in: high G+C Gram-positive bacteria)]|uniref:hypothetical protein n=1 Tax=Rhodococcus sp. TaxID=1831 RepID=UPI003BB63007